MNIHKPLIRFGWLRALIYLIVVASAGLSMPYIQPPVDAVVTANADKSLAPFLTFFISYIILGLLIVFVTWVFMKFVNRQSFMSIGFAPKDYGNEAWIGFFTPIFLLGTGTLLLIFFKYLSISTVVFEPVSLALQLLLMIIVAFVEEIMFRGYFLNNLMQSMNKWIALTLSALLFAFFHIGNPDVTWVALLNVLLAGILLGLNYIFTKNLWYSIIFHFTWNFFQGAILGYDVSGFKLPAVFVQTLTGPSFYTGGAFGFEGSFICSVLLLITIIVFYFVFERRYLDLPV